MENEKRPLLEVKDLSVSFRMYDKGLEQTELPVRFLKNGLEKMSLSNQTYILKTGV